MPYSSHYSPLHILICRKVRCCIGSGTEMLWLKWLTIQQFLSDHSLSTNLIPCHFLYSNSARLREKTGQHFEFLQIPGQHLIISFAFVQTLPLSSPNRMRRSNFASSDEIFSCKFSISLSPLLITRENSDENWMQFQSSIHYLFSICFPGLLADRRLKRNASHVRRSKQNTPDTPSLTMNLWDEHCKTQLRDHTVCGTCGWRLRRQSVWSWDRNHVSQSVSGHWQYIRYRKSIWQ